MISTRKRLSAVATLFILSWILSPLSALPGLGPSRAQAQEGENLAKGWYGTITYTKVSEKTSTDESNTPLELGNYIKFNERAKESYFETITYQVVDGRTTGTAVYSETDRKSSSTEYSIWACTWEELFQGGPGLTGSSTMQQTWSADGSAQGDLSIDVDDEGYYTIYGFEMELMGSYFERTTSSCSGNCCTDPNGQEPVPPTTTRTEESPYYSSSVSIDGQVDRSSNPRMDVLSGTLTVSLDEPSETFTSPVANGGTGSSTTRTVGSVTTTWRLYKQVDVELVVEPKQYDTWRPEATTDGAPGNAIEVLAYLQNKNGGPPDRKATKITLELIDVSREPGVALNYPLASTPGPDLRFDQEFNTTLRVGGQNGERAETKDSPVTEALSVVSSYDWGAFARIKATAILPGGQVVIGYLKGDPAKTLIPLPKREEGSFIAEVWKNSKAPGKADNDDGESAPVGDGTAGDGLSLYEEYRGFYENGRHIEADPIRKDFFIRDEVGGRSKDGIALFVGVTGLVVHHDFKAEEFHPDRVVNINYSGRTPRLVDQHGIYLRNGTQRGYSIAKGGPGNPKKITEVLIAANLNPGPGGWNQVLGLGNGEIIMDPRGGITDLGSGKVLTDAYAATTAHELLHSVNVWHHGQGDERNTVWTYTKQPDGSYIVTEKGQPIVPKTETGQILQVTPGSADTFTRTVWLGVDGGQHSGYEDCAMRYAVAEAYRSDADPATRYVSIFGELKGIFLCDSPTGTGVNDAGHAPQSRYSDAHSGDCIHQILVNDAVEAPSHARRAPAPAPAP